MAYSLRKRLVKKAAAASTTSSPTEDSNSEIIIDSMVSDMDTKLTIDAQDDSRTAVPPPPGRQVKTEKKTTRNASPPQSLLDRYKNRAAKPVVKTSTTHATHMVGKDTAFSEHFDDESAAKSSKWIDVPGTPEYGSDKEVEVVSGVEFEMLGQKGHAAEAPNEASNDEDFTHRRRTTRSKSQSRRQQRADSTDLASDDQPTSEDSTLAPAALTIKKVDDKDCSRTPSPTIVLDKKASTPEHIAPTPSNSPATSKTSSESGNTLVVDRTKNKAEYRLSRSPDPPVAEKTPGYALRRKLPQPPTEDKPLRVSVIAPIYNVNIRPEHIWTSPLASTSRPDYPWGWTKKWTCCQCSQLDSSSGRRPAETMVEQAVCSRLTCGHERCSFGCRMIRDTRFDAVSY